MKSSLVMIALLTIVTISHASNNDPESLAQDGASASQLRSSLNKVTAGLALAPASPTTDRARQVKKLGTSAADAAKEIQDKEKYYEQLRASAPLLARDGRPTAWEEDNAQSQAPAQLVSESTSDSSTSLSASSSGEATAGAVGFSGSVTIHQGS